MSTLGRRSGPVMYRRNVDRWLFPASPLDGAGADASNEIALETQEDSERQSHLDDRGRRQDLPVPTKRRRLLPDEDGQRPVRALTEIGHGDQQVVPDPQEDEDDVRRDGRDAHRDDDAPELDDVIGAIDLGRFEDLL